MTKNNQQQKQKLDHFRYIKHEIIGYINDDACNDDSNRLILLNQSNKYKLNKLAKKILTVPATSSPVERIFSQSGFRFRQHRAKMSRKNIADINYVEL